MAKEVKWRALRTHEVGLFMKRARSGEREKERTSESVVRISRISMNETHSLVHGKLGNR